MDDAVTVVLVKTVFLIWIKIFFNLYPFVEERDIKDSTTLVKLKKEKTNYTFAIFFFRQKISHLFKLYHTEKIELKKKKRLKKNFYKGFTKNPNKEISQQKI